MRNVLLVGGAIALGFLGACTPKVSVNYMRPAEVNLKGINQIAIGGIWGGPQYGVAAQSMKGQLEEAIFNSGRFKLVDRSNTSKVIGEIALSQSGFMETSSAPKLGQLLPASVLVFGSITKYNVGEKVERSANPSRVEENGTKHWNYTRTAWADVEVNFQVIYCETGEILAVKTVRAHREDYRTEEDNPTPAYINTDPLLDSARYEVVERFMKVIAPYQDTAIVRLQKDKKVPQMAQGINYIKAGSWNEAIKTLEEAYAAYPSNPKVIYNLGICYEYTYQFDRAEELFNKAYGIKPNGAYKAELENNRRMKAEYIKLQQQQ